jgi:hypothetical protein
MEQGHPAELGTFDEKTDHDASGLIGMELPNCPLPNEWGNACCSFVCGPAKHVIVSACRSTGPADPHAMHCIIMLGTTCANCVWIMHHQRHQKSSSLLSLLEHEALAVPPCASMVRSIQSSGETGDHGLGPALCMVKPEMKTHFFCCGCQASINKLLTGDNTMKLFT